MKVYSHCQWSVCILALAKINNNCDFNHPESVCLQLVREQQEDFLYKKVTDRLI